ncbi:MAG: hypothetical protein JWM68_525 [Verrucomicrobiales bacterium]|nr:hypothetical protein [Verrucomicrobiales bacterium]
MKKSLFLLASTIAFTVGSLTNVLAFKAPDRVPLPQFDKRVGVGHDLTDDRKAMVKALKSHVPNANVRVDKLLGAPEFISSYSHFLTGPNGQGGAVSAAQAKLIAPGDAHGPVKAFLNEHSALFGYGSEILSSAQVKREFVTPHNGMRTVIWEQQLDEIPVFESILMGNITKNGELVNLSTHFVSDLKKAADAGRQNRATGGNEPSINAADAIVNAARSIKHFVARNQLSPSDEEQGPQKKRHFRATAVLNGEINTALVWIPMDGQTLRLAWQVILTSRERGEMFLFVVDATSGEVIVQRCLTNYISNATYNVFTSDSPSPFSPGHLFPSTNQPPVIARTSVTLAALNTTASPNGWINDTDNETLGNNVDSHTDRDDDDQPDLPRPQGNPTRVFDFPLDLTKDPTNSSEAAVVQLFYWNNFIHDKLYELGFTEAAGNFQQDNFGRGGSAGDAVRADAQDGGGFDNANMSTPPDGFAPRMQMYLFSGPTPNRDGDLDAEVILHEYTHGLSNRRVGGGVGISQWQTGGMGEGWSDFYAMALLSESSDNVDGNFGQGGYVTYNLSPNFAQNYYYGIRRYPYSTDLLKNPLTFKDIDPTQASPHFGIPRNPVIGNTANEVHNIGEVWCVTLWEVRVALIKKYGFSVGNTLAMRLVTDGMTLSPANPNFLEARNAIINADKVDTGGANYALLWIAFAKRGMGGSATSPSSSTTIGVFQAFDLPGLTEVAVQSDDSQTGNNNGTVDPNECNYIYVSIQNGGTNTASAISAVLSSSTPGVTVEQSSSPYPNLAAGGIANNSIPFRIYTSPSFACGTPIVFSLIIDSSAEHRTNQFRLKTGFITISPTYYSSSTQVSIPDGSSVGASSSLVINNFNGTVGKATVSLYLTHTYDSDLTIELIAPNGAKVALARNAGGFGHDFGTNCSPLSSRTTFDDGASTDISGGTAPFVGLFRPSEPLENLAGQSGNGTWQLHVVDDVSVDSGQIECWSLALYPTVCTDGGGGCGADVALSATGPATATAGSNIVYALTITNTRPVQAVGITLTNVLPAGFNFVSAVSSQGGCVFTNGVINGTLGSLSNGVITVSITVTPTVAGTVTNKFSVGAANDANPNNNLASVITSIAPASPIIVGSGAQITSESYSPANGGIESGETVTVNLSLRNTGTSSTSSNLVANLVSGGGVGSPGAAQTYGVLGAGGASVTKPFTFTASAVPGATIVAALQLQDGAVNLGTVNFTFVIGASGTFPNSSTITIIDGGVASTYPSTITVSGLTGIVSKVTVSLSKFTHSFPDDVDVLLVGPAGQKVLLMSDVGGEIGVTNQTLTFDSSITNKLPDNGPIVAGTFAPTDYQTGDAFISPAPAGPYNNSLDFFKATNPNGVWSLYVVDDTGQDFGAINGGWSLSIDTVVPVNTNADVAVTITASANPAVIAADLTYTILVSNFGQNAATGVMVTNIIPASAAYISATTSQGSYSYSAGKVVCNIGTVSAGGTATITVTVSAGSGNLVSSVQSGANELDLNLANNTASLTTPTRAAQSDLVVKGSASSASVLVNSNLTYTLAVTNLGPDSAVNVVLTNTFSSSVSYVSGNSTQGVVTNLGSAVVANLGTISAGSNVLVTIVVAPANVGTLTNTIVASSSGSDTNTANNITNVVASVIFPSPTIVASGSAILAESFAPADNALEPGETLTMNFALRNIGSGPTTNLTATLLSTGGVIPLSGAANYGALLPGGSSSSRSFTFTANGTNNGVLTATLALQDGTQSLGNVSFNYALSSVQTFSNSGVILITAVGAASPYPVNIAVAGVTGSVSKVTVIVSNLSHAFPEDVDMLLVSPTGQKIVLMSDAGAGNTISNVTLKFDDSGTILPQSSKIASGTYAPTDYSPADAFQAPAPAGPYASSLCVLNGLNPNGTWSLYIVDDSGGDAGRIDGGWSLSFVVATTVTNNVDLAIQAGATPDSLLTGSNITYTINVANSGPGAANNVVLSDLLPANFNVISNAMSQGSVSAIGSTLNYNLGSLGVGGSASITLLASPSAVGSFTNLLSVQATESDLNLGNNSQSLVTVVVAVPSSFGSSSMGTNRNFQFTFTGQVGFSYVIEGSTNLSNWVPISTNTILNGGTLQFIDVNAPAHPYRFYRAHVQ